MKKLLIILFISVLGKLFAMEIHVENLNLKKNKLEFSIRIELNNDSKVCCTNLDNPCYKVINNKLYIYYKEIDLPDNVNCDFPKCSKLKFINSDLSFKTQIKLKYNNTISFSNDFSKFDISKIKSIVFVFGYIENYDELITIKTDDSEICREQFFYVISNQKEIICENSVKS